jgi:hypothetical protein
MLEQLSGCGTTTAIQARLLRFGAAIDATSRAVRDASEWGKALLDGQGRNSRALKRKRVAFFRRAAVESGTRPTILTSDDVVFDIHQNVFHSFADACRRAGRTMPNRWTINFIVLKFLEVNEVVGGEIINSLLDCEVRWYVKSVLQAMYDCELRP